MISSVIANAFSFPAFTCGSTEVTLGKPSCIWPVMTPRFEAGIPLYGTCTSLTPVISSNSAPARCDGRAVAGRAVVELPGTAFRQRNHLLHAVRGDRRVADEEQRRLPDQRDRLEILDRVVRHLREERRAHGERVRDEHQRVAVRAASARRARCRSSRSRRRGCRRRTASRAPRSDAPRCSAPGCRRCRPRRRARSCARASWDTSPRRARTSPPSHPQWRCRSRLFAS